MRTFETDDQRGFTLAGLIVILTIMSIIVAYSVPQQWSLVMKRERDRQTIFVMRQYARAVLGHFQKHQALPTSLEQLRDARKPRMIRNTASAICPLTNEEDWILVPPQAVTAGAVQPGAGQPQAGPLGTGSASPTGRDLWNSSGNRGNVTGANPVTQPTQPMQPTTGAPPSTLNAQLSPKDYKGPFVGVRPNKAGPSLVALNGVEDYGQWVFTYQDMDSEVQLRRQALYVK